MTPELTPTQMKILLLMPHGLTGVAMARHLGVSYNTVTSHVSAIYTTLGANNRAEAIAAAVRHGLIEMTVREL